MKRLLIILPVILILISCNKNTVLLPETSTKEITEILDVSPIYIFYDETKPDSIDFNRKNMISTTNWLVNIDKRLTLKQILPHLQYFQEKRSKEGMHKNENAKNYFTCFNPEIQNLAFIEFTDVKFIADTLFLFTQPKLAINPEGIPKIFEGMKTVNFIKDLSFYFDKKHYAFKSLSSFIDNLSKTHPSSKSIALKFHESLSFQDYIEIKTQIFTMKSASIIISNIEFIYY